VGKLEVNYFKEAAAKKVLKRLKSDLDGLFGLGPNDPLTTVAKEAFHQEIVNRMERVKQLPLKPKTIEIRRRGGEAPVTVGGGTRRIKSESTEAGVRTGFMMEKIEAPLEQLAGKEFGYTVTRSGFGSNIITEFTIKLDEDRFFEQYPLIFSEWVYRNTGLHLLDLEPDSQLRILNKVSNAILEEISTLLKGR